MLMATWQYQEYEARASRSMHLARTSAAPGAFQSYILYDDSAFTDTHSLADTQKQKLLYNLDVATYCSSMTASA